ncbi:MAG: bifunctional phosphopantothenoylcysteine decarboxylase/phosphopantothenate--cysteine ligase CoaBC [Chloroflexi bacterium]|nr:bifunctional phosphopantothenoylcysteine decarboxylase/phosphopantothenate--cysteine ligase CoaBC [Chloroflexota bacterium]MQC16981.1 bifunctional phosphopantothenoylcysteine decarboxylase/phosphopantothenate--cysteine ligase CoaBC [Chloroflexota bacterium]MQC48026.1 bifunctional phosphopantothenoylcysteine decarboxylase/phosphopantothenate--cysteine ligase CoaBC [Chloroflexota bacterium]
MTSEIPGRPGDPLRGAHIVLGVTGSISCYKAVEVASRLVQAGATVDVAMTSHATEFVAPLTFRSITAREPYSDMWRPHGEYGEAHVELARRADLLLIAPATASSLARLAHGLADDMVALTALATTAPVLVAPAMDGQMWEHEATQANVSVLRDRGVQFIGPVSGRLASGRLGAGRLVEPVDIVDTARARLARERGDYLGRKVVVSAGGTREAIDPVRYVGNRSSGKMGYATAEAARDRGAEVVVVSTVALPVPAGVRVVSVESALQMQEAVLAECADADALIMAGAIADYRPAIATDHKIKREVAGDFTIELVENPDIIASVPTQNARPGGLVKVAFAAETDDLVANAQRKLERKGARFVVANDVTATDAGFSVDDNRVTILDDEGGSEAYPLMSKYAVGHVIMDRLKRYLDS